MPAPRPGLHYPDRRSHRAGQVAASIDKLFVNSAHETKTADRAPDRPEQPQNRSADIGPWSSNAIVAAVFFALLFLGRRPDDASRCASGRQENWRS